MFGDLDWPLNASRGFVTISWASCWNEKKRSERRKHCALPKIFAPPQIPCLGGAGRPKFSQLEMVTTFTSVWWGSMHAISSYRGNRPTHTNKPTDRTDYAQCNEAVNGRLSGQLWVLVLRAMLCLSQSIIRNVFLCTSRVGGIERWCASDVSLSVAYIGPKSRTESPRKIGTEVAHVTIN